MSNWQPLNRQKHSHLGLHPAMDFFFAAHCPWVILNVAELSHALPWYPLAFTPLQPTDSPIESVKDFELIAILGLSKAHNLFVTKFGTWAVPYVPAAYRAYPFGWLNRTDGGLLVAVDEGCERLENPTSNEAIRLFDDQGQPTQQGGRLLAFLQECADSRLLTRRLCLSLFEAGLFEPWPLTQDDALESSTGAKRLLRINEQRLRDLSGAQLKELAQNGALTLAYAQLFSQARIQDLYQRQQKIQSHVSSEPVSVGTDDTIRFNF
jgi:hypothetical protein